MDQDQIFAALIAFLFAFFLYQFFLTVRSLLDGHFPRVRLAITAGTAVSLVLLIFLATAGLSLTQHSACTSLRAQSSVLDAARGTQFGTPRKVRNIVTSGQVMATVHCSALVETTSGQVLQVHYSVEDSAAGWGMRTTVIQPTGDGR